MFEAKVNDGTPQEVKETPEGWMLDGNLVNADIAKLGPQSFSVIMDNRSHQVFVESVDAEEKVVHLRINDKKATVSLTSELDRLLKEMGLEGMAAQKATDLKAPMPGLIHSILVAPGDEVQKGDGVLILEAMKMENVIKAPADVTIASIEVEKGASVEKGALLVKFS